MHTTNEQQPLPVASAGSSDRYCCVDPTSSAADGTAFSVYS